jgi:hypothetical protein
VAHDARDRRHHAHRRRRESEGGERRAQQQLFNNGPAAAAGNRNVKASLARRSSVPRARQVAINDDNDDDDDAFQSTVGDDTARAQIDARSLSAHELALLLSPQFSDTDTRRSGDGRTEDLNDDARDDDGEGDGVVAPERLSDEFDDFLTCD